MVKIKNFDVKGEFEKHYTSLRELENRILSLEQIRSLPYLKGHPLENEWKMRIKSTNRLTKHIRSKQPKSVLDLGCGNGWLSLKIADFVQELVCMDINLLELKQAAKVLEGKDNITIVYNNILENNDFGKFDLILLNASVQYFPSLSELILKLKDCLTSTGSIHIIDSPFYFKKDIANAKMRSTEYYNSKGADAMEEYYYHHTWEELEKFSPITHYNHNQIFKKISVYLGINDSPFPWIEILKRP